MPTKKQGKGALHRYNQKKPAITFRSPNNAFKQRIKKAADMREMAMGAYIVQAIGAYMEAASSGQSLSGYIDKKKLENVTGQSVHELSNRLKPQTKKDQPLKKEDIDWSMFDDKDM